MQKVGARQVRQNGAVPETRKALLAQENSICWGKERTFHHAVEMTAMNLMCSLTTGGFVRGHDTQQRLRQLPVKDRFLARARMERRISLSLTSRRLEYSAK
jgi:hypothetical protein